jgi:hypothetical protein
MACVKTQRMSNNSYVKTSKFIFFTRAQKNPDNLCVDVKYVDVHAKFYFRFFDTPKFSFTQ